MLNTKPNLMNDPVVIRLATTGDADSLELLAELDSARAPDGPVLLAELRGRPVVALSVDGGVSVADPFVPTAQLRELLRLWAQYFRPPAHVPVGGSRVGLPAAAGHAIRHARGRLQRLLQRPRAAVPSLNQGDQPIQHGG